MPPAIQTKQIGVWQMQIYIKFINYGRIWLFISPVLSLLGENPALYLPLPMGSTLPFGNTRYFSSFAKKQAKPYLQLYNGHYLRAQTYR